MNKVFILDTNVVLSAAEGVYKFEKHDVVIPISVIEELDRFKKELSDTGRNARHFSRILDGFRARGSLKNGVIISPEQSDSGKIFVDFNADTSMLPTILASTVDNQILSTALKLKSERPKDNIIIVSKDSNLRIKSDVFGVQAEDFEADKIQRPDEIFCGFTKKTVTAEQVQAFYSQNRLSLEFGDREIYPNEYIVLESETPGNQPLLARYEPNEKVCKPIQRAVDGIYGIYPKNIEQTMAIDMLLDDSISLVTMIGGAGTGKTLLALASGLLKTTDEDQYNKLLVSRPIFPMGKDIGYLPGDIEDKLNPWMQPIYDNLDLLFGASQSNKQKRLGRSYQELLNQGILEVEPLTYIRGRSIPKVFLIVDEAQNLTHHEIKTILTRAGENTKVVLTGDPYQIDNPYLDASSNGLAYVIDRFKKQKVAAHITLSKGERSILATLAAEIL